VQPNLNPIIVNCPIHIHNHSGDNISNQSTITNNGLPPLLNRTTNNGLALTAQPYKTPEEERGLDNDKSTNSNLVLPNQTANAVEGREQEQKEGEQDEAVGEGGGQEQKDETGAIDLTEGEEEGEQDEAGDSAVVEGGGQEQKDETGVIDLTEGEETSAATNAGTGPDGDDGAGSEEADLAGAEVEETSAATNAGTGSDGDEGRVSVTKTKEPRGIKNPKNICFFSSYLQCMKQVPVFG
jgi:hypothetical protein